MENDRVRSSRQKLEIKDDIGVDISFEAIPRRIISLAPNITETLYAIGADSLVVGVTDFCDYPSAAKHKTSTGSYLGPDYEIIASLKPDLIIMNVESSSNPTYQALKNLNTKIFVSNAKNIEGILKMLEDLGKITGKEDVAGKLAEKISTERSNYASLIDSTKTKGAFITVSVNPLMTANGSTFISEITELAGFKNIYRNERIDYPLISYEDITFKNPFYIILPCDTNDTINLEKFENEILKKLNTTDAGKNKRIIFIDENIMFRPGPRVMEAVRLLKAKRAEGNYLRH